MGKSRSNYGARGVKDAVIVFYDISYDQDGMIVDAEYNFVERGEFNKTYNII